MHIHEYQQLTEEEKLQDCQKTCSFCIDAQTF